MVAAFAADHRAMGPVNQQFNVVSELTAAVVVVDLEWLNIS